MAIPIEREGEILAARNSYRPYHLSSDSRRSRDWNENCQSLIQRRTNGIKGSNSMYSKVKLAGQPLHTMLISFPITFYTITFAQLVLYQFFNVDDFWYKSALHCNYAAVATALVAVVPGIIDYTFRIPKNSEARKVGVRHVTLNLVALALYAINAAMLWNTENTPILNLNSMVWLTGFGFVFVLSASYNGWALVGRYKAGVDLTPEQEKEENNVHNLYRSA